MVWFCVWFLTRRVAFSPIFWRHRRFLEVFFNWYSLGLFCPWVSGVSMPSVLTVSFCPLGFLMSIVSPSITLVVCAVVFNSFVEVGFWVMSSPVLTADNVNSVIRRIVVIFWGCIDRMASPPKVLVFLVCGEE